MNRIAMKLILGAMLLAAVPSLAGTVVETLPQVFEGTVVFSNTVDTAVRAKQKGTNYVLDGESVTNSLLLGNLPASDYATDAEARNGRNQTNTPWSVGTFVQIATNEMEVPLTSIALTSIVLTNIEGLVETGTWIADLCITNRTNKQGTWSSCVQTGIVFQTVWTNFGTSYTATAGNYFLLHGTNSVATNALLSAQGYEVGL